ncbi:hypothetical protein M5689_024384 [Euphorbia peplus]|nr:hypothetical protein M5689_024384 [Euphorbia peplus]
MSQVETPMEDAGQNANNAPPNPNPSKPPLPKEIEASLKPKKKSMKAGSKAWGHFTKFEDDEGEKKAKCNYCGKEFKCHSRTNGTI